MSRTGVINEFAAADEVGGKPEMPCHLCGDRDYAWGDIYANGINFIPEDDPWWSKILRHGRKLRARRCESCGNVQLFA
ncbi:hypothetical protein TA3x_004017 [Tundrisphaera sp. TA3]|uniref:hypothetical protein n=1 Tax=Tundrisphaera sp. TA3 TaxID=3435775 RepID=UPI003EBEB306